MPKKDEYQLLKETLLSNPELLKKKIPFTRGIDRAWTASNKAVEVNERIDVSKPSTRKIVVTQEQFQRELDPECHDVLFDDNIPSLCVKVSDGDYREVHFTRMSIPFQKIIKNKQLLHLTGNPMQFTLVSSEPTEQDQKNFTLFKQYWEVRNQDGMKKRFVDKQLSYGDAGLLYYFDRFGHIKSRILSFDEGYVICSHNDQNGDRLIESVYYERDGVEYIDSYDDKYMYRWTNNSNNEENDGWVMDEPVLHQFNEIPLITKRGEVAWNGVQHIIESYEVLYNVFNAIKFGDYNVGRNDKTLTIPWYMAFLFNEKTI